MTYFVVKGTFHVEGYSPDGDSVRFLADDMDFLKKLPGPDLALSKAGHAMLRFEAIDALETHFGGHHHQPIEFAFEARELLLTLLGIKNVQWNEKGSKITSADDGTLGYLLTNKIENRGRVLSFVYTGTINKKTGDKIFVDKKLIKQSLNYKIIEKGLAFPTYYINFLPELRNEFTKAVEKARKTGIGFWPLDKTNKGVIVEDIEDVSETNIIMPKLFRRIAAFFEKHSSIDEFKTYLEKQDDQLIILPTNKKKILSDIVTVKNKTVKLTKKPENIVFEEK